jgi:hypothetical protein
MIAALWLSHAVVITLLGCVLRQAGFSFFW